MLACDVWGCDNEWMHLWWNSTDSKLEASCQEHEEAVINWSIELDIVITKLTDDEIIVVRILRE